MSSVINPKIVFGRLLMDAQRMQRWSENNAGEKFRTYAIQYYNATKKFSDTYYAIFQSSQEPIVQPTPPKPTRVLTPYEQGYNNIPHNYDPDTQQFADWDRGRYDADNPTTNSEE